MSLILVGLVVLVLTPDKFFSKNYRRSETILNSKESNTNFDPEDEDYFQAYNSKEEFGAKITPESPRKKQQKLDEEKYKK